MNKKTWLSVNVVFLAFGIPLSGSEGEAPWQGWRRAENGGINALYCYLRVYGVSCEYADLLLMKEEEVGAGFCSANTLTRFAEERGVPLTVVSLTMNELEACVKPVIVHMDGRTPAAGAFLLLFGFSDETVYYVNGPTASIHQSPRNEFRRVWNGIALVPKSGRNWGWIYRIIGLITGVLLILLVRNFLLRNQK